MKVLITALAVLALALPLASAAAPKPKPQPGTTASVTAVQSGPCELTVTYTWSGFVSNRPINASFGVFRKIDSTAKLWYRENVGPVSGSGTLTDSFELSWAYSPGQTLTWYGFGRLSDDRSVLTGSEIEAAPVTLTC